MLQGVPAFVRQSHLLRQSQPWFCAWKFEKAIHTSRITMMKLQEHDAIIQKVNSYKIEQILVFELSLISLKTFNAWFTKQTFQNISNVHIFTLIFWVDLGPVWLDQNWNRIATHALTDLRDPFVPAISQSHVIVVSAFVLIKMCQLFKVQFPFRWILKVFGIQKGNKRGVIHGKVSGISGLMCECFRVWYPNGIVFLKILVSIWVKIFGLVGTPLPTSCLNPIVTWIFWFKYMVRHVTLKSLNIPCGFHFTIDDEHYPGLQ